jgi:hypothetical protein
MARSSQCREAGPGDGAFTALKEQSLLVLIVQQLAEAQFVRADRAATERLWQEVGALQLDCERVTQLLYGGADSHDREALRAADSAWLARQPTRSPRRWGFPGWRPRWGGHQPGASTVAALNTSGGDRAHRPGGTG